MPAAVVVQKLQARPSRWSVNKIDLPTADVEKAKAEIEAVIGIDAEDAVAVSAKTGLNVEEVLQEKRRDGV